MLQEQKLQAMFETISLESDRQQQDMLEKAKADLDQKLKAAEADALAETFELITRRSAAIREETGRRISAAEVEARAGLFRRREQIRREVFAKAAERILAFTATDNYKKLLLASADRIAAAMKGHCSILFLCERDRPLAADICAHLGTSITLHIDPGIRLGGIMVEADDNRMMIDDTLDTRLSQQEQWFMENSGLNIE